jgi:hypothetical protein
MKRIFPLVLITLGLLLSVAALGQLYLNNRAISPASTDLPKELTGLNLTQTQTGSKAISEFADLHGKEFPVVSGAIGIYGDRKITLWVAGAESESIAVEMTNAMQSKIAQGNSPFTPVDEIKDRSRTIYVLEGMGQKHFYFQSNNLVIWLAVDPAIADDALQQILEVYS